MRYLLDTNVVSEALRPRPAANVVSWLEAQRPLDLCISALTLGEVLKGVRLLASGEKRERLEHWLATGLAREFQGRVLPVDDAAALAWGGLAAEAALSGRPLSVIDGLLLATAALHGLTLVTRNVRNCEDRGVPVFDPWSGG